MGNGAERTPEELSEQMLRMQEQKCHNLNLVTPSHFMPQILKALGMARQRGFELPIVYNTNGYESLEALRLLDGIVDIYLPDIRYSDDGIAFQHSVVSDYAETNRAAIKEMYRQVGNLVVDENGIGIRGLIIRHLILPGGLSGTERTMKFLSEEISKDVYISLMSQYFPAYKAPTISELSRRITSDEYEDARRIMEKYGLENGWMQEL
jgi:putative pyruvate formate lyase activating enzyme